MRAFHRTQRRDGLGQRRTRVADVRSEPDVCADRLHVDLRAVCESDGVAHAAVRILHLEPGEDAGELGRLLATARSIAAEDLAQRFRDAGAEDVAIERGGA